METVVFNLHIITDVKNVNYNFFTNFAMLKLFSVLIVILNQKYSSLYSMYLKHVQFLHADVFNSFCRKVHKWEYDMYL